MKSCMHNGNVHYIFNTEDLKEVMDVSVYECVESIINDLKTRITALEDTIEDNTIEREDLYDEIGKYRELLDALH